MGALARLLKPPIIAVIIVLVVCAILWFTIPPAFNRLFGRNQELRMGSQAVVTTQELVPMRAEPKNAAPVVMIAPQGQVVTLVESGNGDGGRWYKVRVEVSTTKQTIEGWLPEKTPGGQTVLAAK